MTGDCDAAARIGRPMPAALHIVGLGPGSADCLTPQAERALAASACIAGYGRYVELVPDALRAGKRIISNGMRQEEERCAAALDSALSGVPTSLVCSGDPGIYALAGLALEQAEERGVLGSLPLEIVPGMPPAANGCWNRRRRCWARRSCMTLPASA